jgi:hypothetical protein
MTLSKDTCASSAQRFNFDLGSIKKHGEYQETAF